MSVRHNPGSRKQPQGLIECLTNMNISTAISARWNRVPGKEKIINTRFPYSEGCANHDDPSKYKHMLVDRDDPNDLKGAVWTAFDELCKEESRVKAAKLLQEPPNPINNARVADEQGSNIWVWQFLPDPEYVAAVYDSEAGNAEDLQRDPFRYGTLRVGLVSKRYFEANEQKLIDLRNRETQTYTKNMKDNNSHKYSIAQHDDKYIHNKNTWLDVVVVYEFDFTLNHESRRSMDLASLTKAKNVTLQHLVSQWRWDRDSGGEKDQHSLWSMKASVPGTLYFFCPKSGNDGTTPLWRRFHGLSQDSLNKLRTGKPLVFPKKKTAINKNHYYECTDWTPLSVYANAARDGVHLQTYDEASLKGIHALYDAAGDAAGESWPQANITYDLLVRLTPHRIRSRALEIMRQARQASYPALYERVYAYLQDDADEDEEAEDDEGDEAPPTDVIAQNASQAEESTIVMRSPAADRMLGRARAMEAAGSPTKKTNAVRSLAFGGASSAASSANNVVIEFRTPVTHRFPKAANNRPSDAALCNPSRDLASTSIDALVGESGILQATTYALHHVEITSTRPNRIAKPFVVSADELSRTVLPAELLQSSTSACICIVVMCYWISEKWFMPYDIYYKLYEQSIDDVSPLYEIGTNSVQHSLAARARCFIYNTARDVKEDAEAFLVHTYPNATKDSSRTPRKAWRDRRNRQLLEHHTQWREQAVADDEEKEKARRQAMYAELSSDARTVLHDEDEDEAGDEDEDESDAADHALWNYYRCFDPSRQSLGMAPYWRDGKGNSSGVSYACWNRFLPSVGSEPQYKVYSMVNAFKLIPDDLEMLFGPVSKLFTRTKTHVAAFDDHKTFPTAQNSLGTQYARMMAHKIVYECSRPCEQEEFASVNNRVLDLPYVYKYLAYALFSDDLVHPDTLVTFDIIAECKPGGRVVGYVACTESKMLENSLSVEALSVSGLSYELSTGAFSPLYNLQYEDEQQASATIKSMKAHVANIYPNVIPKVFNTLLFKILFDRAIWALYDHVDLQALHYKKQSPELYKKLCLAPYTQFMKNKGNNQRFVTFHARHCDNHLCHSECSVNAHRTKRGIAFLADNFIGVGLGRSWDEEMAHNDFGGAATWNLYSRSRIPTIALMKNYWLKGFGMYDEQGRIPPHLDHEERLISSLCEQTENPTAPLSHLWKRCTGREALHSSQRELWSGRPSDSMPGWYFQVPVGAIDRRAFRAVVQDDPDGDRLIPCAPVAGSLVGGRNIGLYECLKHRDNLQKRWHNIQFCATRRSAKKQRRDVGPGQDNRLWCACHSLGDDGDGDEGKLETLLKSKAEYHYGYQMARGEYTMATIANFVDYDGNRGVVVEESKSVSTYWDAERFTDKMTRDLLPNAVRRELMFCAMQPLTYDFIRQTRTYGEGPESQLSRKREDSCSWMSYPNIQQSDNPWLGHNSEFASSRDQSRANPQLSLALRISSEFANLYNWRPNDETGDDIGNLFRSTYHSRVIEGGAVGRAYIASAPGTYEGMRWFQLSLRNGSIVRTDYEVVDSTIVFNACVGVSCGAAAFVVAYQIHDGGRWSTFDRASLFVSGLNGLPKDRVTPLRMKTMLYGDLTGNLNMSLRHILEGENVQTAFENGLVGLQNLKKTYKQQSLECATWRLKPAVFPAYNGNVTMYGHKKILSVTQEAFDADVRCQSSKINALVDLKNVLPDQDSASKEQYTTQIYLLADPAASSRCYIHSSRHDYEALSDDPKSTTVNKYNVGLRFVRDYFALCDANNRMQTTLTAAKKEWLQNLSLAKDGAAHAFAASMLGMPLNRYEE